MTAPGIAATAGAELRVSQRPSWRSALRVLVPCATLPVFLLAALPVYTPAQRMLAWAIFALGTAPMLRYFARPSGVPLIELVSLQYALFFGAPVFYEGELRLVGGMTQPAEGAITLALGCALAALTYVLIGYAMATRVVRVPFSVTRFVPSTRRLLVYGCGVSLVSMALPTLGYGSAATAGALAVLLPRTLGLSVLACLFYGAPLGRRARLSIIAVFAVATIWGMRTTMTQLVVEPAIIWVLARWIFARKTPVLPAIVLALVFMILQPIKGYYRGYVNDAGQAPSIGEQLRLLSTLSRSYWRTASETQSYSGAGKVAAAQRLSLLMSTARYMELTPEYISYKGPTTLLYPAYSWVPRAVWPNKPTAQEANKILPVEAAIQTPDNLATTMFGVGHVAEVYTALGLAGIMPVFLIIGFLYAVPVIVLRDARNIASTMLLLWFAVNMMYIEGTVGSSFGSLLQQLVIQSLVLRAATRRRGVAA